MPTFATQSWLRTRAARADAIATGVFGRWWRRGTGLGEGVEMKTRLREVRLLAAR